MFAAPVIGGIGSPPLEAGDGLVAGAGAGVVGDAGALVAPDGAGLVPGLPPWGPDLFGPCGRLGVLSGLLAGPPPSPRRSMSAADSVSKPKIEPIGLPPVMIRMSFTCFMESAARLARYISEACSLERSMLSRAS